MIGLLFLAVAIVVLGLVWITGPRGRVIGYGLIAVIVLSDTVPWAAAKLFARSLRRDEIRTPVNSVVFREADFAARSEDPANEPFKYILLLESGTLHRFYYRPAQAAELAAQHVFLPNVDYEMRLVEDRTCNGADRFNIGFGLEIVCLKYNLVTQEPMAPRVIPFDHRGPLRWPVEAVSYAAIATPDGKVLARACVTYRGAFWAWFRTQMVYRWNAGGTVSDPPQILRSTTCDGDVGSSDNWQQLFTG